MSRTMTISSWPTSKTVVSTSSGRCRRPANCSAYARATRAGVSRRPSRSGSSPIANRISRTARSMRGRSNSSLVMHPVSSVAAGPAVVVHVLAVARTVIAVARAAIAVAVPVLAVAIAVAARRPRPPRVVAERLAVGGQGQARPPGAAVGGGQGEFLGREHRRAVRGQALAVAGVGAADRPLHDGREDLQDLGPGYRLLVQQPQHQRVEHVAVLHEDLPGLVVRGLDEAADL